MKNIFGNKSQATTMSSNRQFIDNMAILAKYDTAKFDAANYDAAEYDDQAIEIDEMQIDKLYQSL